MSKYQLKESDIYLPGADIPRNRLEIEQTGCNSMNLKPDVSIDDMSYDAMANSIHDIAESIQSLNQQAVRDYTPVIESILRTHDCETSHIEITLDGLLSFCGYAPALVLYKKLCRHYWEIAPDATASYIYAYRDIWESEEKVEDK